MSTLTLQQRLDIYRKALNDYRLNRYQTRFGFCNYLACVHAIDFEDYPEEILPELYAQRPRYAVAYWFANLGPIPERIACIEAAIKLCEEQLKETTDEG